MKKGFRKVDPDRWEFANAGFLRGQKHLLKEIKRRKPPSSSPLQRQSLGPCVEIGRFGLDQEIDRLRRDRNILMTELVSLRQQQQDTRAQLQSMEERLQETEQKQQHMMTFLAKAIQHPNFIGQLVQLKEHRKQLEDAITKKRRRPIDICTRHEEGTVVESSTSRNQEAHTKREAGSFEEVLGVEISELEALALEIQGFRRIKKGEDEERRQRGKEIDDEDKELSAEFWEELLNEKIGGEKVATDAEGREDEEVNRLTERIGDLGSSPK